MDLESGLGGAASSGLGDAGGVWPDETLPLRSCGGLKSELSLSRSCPASSQQRERISTSPTSLAKDKFFFQQLRNYGGGVD